jgi:Tol biopolymer transport system component
MWKKVVLLVTSTFLIFIAGCLSKDVSEISPISGLAAYSSLINSDPSRRDIFVQDLESGEITQLTNSGTNHAPKWSPDGSKILFLSFTKDNSFDIYIMNKDGKNKLPVVASPANEVTADWSPDGNKIAYISDEDGKPRIYVVDLKTQTSAKVTNDIVVNSGALNWSPDGKRIIFVSSMGQPNTPQVFVMNADGTNILQITDNFSYLLAAPVWCPNNACIIYTPNRPRIMSLDLESMKVVPLIDAKFPLEKEQADIARSPVRGYITFSVDGVFYALDMASQEIYSIGIRALDLSLYP